MEMAGYLTLPAGVQSPDKLPMVLLPHGGPHVEVDRWAFDNDAQFLARRGYLVLQVNFRGSEGRGHAFEGAGYRHWDTRVQADRTARVRGAIAQGHADPARFSSSRASLGACVETKGGARAPALQPSA